MAVNPSSFGVCPQFEDSSGNPASGNKLFFYQAGTTTKQNTYTDSTGTVANPNPIILNSLGMPPNEIWWPNGSTYKMVYAPSTDTDPPTSPIRTFDNLRGINDTAAAPTASEWVLSTSTPTYVSATSFTVPGNQTATFEPNRRIKTTNTAGTVYSTISSSVFSTVTTITVVNDGATVLDSGLSAVSYGVLSYTNNSYIAKQVNGTLSNTTVGTTQSPSDNSTKIATTAYADAAVAALVTVAPGAVVSFARNSAPTGWLKCNGAAVSRSTYANLFSAIINTSVVTMTIASPGVITWTAHGRSANDPVKFTTTGALPTGFLAATTYYVVGASITANTFQLSATPGGAAINTSGSQSGVHTAIFAPFGDGDGSTTFNVPEIRGEFLRGWDDSRGIDSNRSFGAAQSPTSIKDIVTNGSNITINNGESLGTSTLSYFSTNTGSTSSTEYAVRPRNVALLYCIKT